MDLKHSINKAKSFLLDNLGEDKLWRDFYTQTHGESIDWVTAYVGDSICRAGETKNLGPVAKALAERQNENGGWGYNHIAIPDADSTAFSIIFLARFGSFLENLKKAKRFLLSHQRLSGGFGTYNESEIRKYSRIPPGSSVDGWTRENPEVTATCLKALIRTGHVGKEKAAQYILATENENGWRSYWWNSDIYANANCVEALADYLRKPKTFHNSEQASTAIPFYQGLSLSYISDPAKREKVLDEIVDSQRKDGSWESYPILRFPSPRNQEPWNDLQRWRDDATDQNRLFTTATILSRLVSIE